MVNHKLEIKASLNGYEFNIKDVTGFGDGGYSSTTLNVNNVQAVLLLLKSSTGAVQSSLRLEGSAKNDFMTGLLEVTMQSSNANNGWGEFKPDIYTVESYLITKTVDVIGYANYSSITGTGLDSALEDPFVVDGNIVYEVDDTANTVGGTVLQLRSVIRRFFNKGGFGYKFSQTALNYVKVVKVVFRLANMRYNTLQKDGESENYMVLTGHLNVLKWMEESGSEENLSFILRDAGILANYLDNKYFRLQ